MMDLKAREKKKEDAVQEGEDKMYKGMRICGHSLWHIEEWNVLRAA